MLSLEKGALLGRCVKFGFQVNSKGFQKRKAPRLDDESQPLEVLFAFNIFESDSMSG